MEKEIKARALNVMPTVVSTGLTMSTNGLGFPMFETTKIEFKKIHTDKKRLFLSEMMTKVASETAKKFEREARLEFCPCCKSGEIVFFTKKFEYDMDKCSECNHIFTNPMPREEALQYFYNSSLPHVILVRVRVIFLRENFPERLSLTKMSLIWIHLILMLSLCGTLLSILLTRKTY